MAGQEYDWYRKALAGEKPPIHEGQPQCGFFIKGKGRDRQPVAIWLDDQVAVGMAATVGFSSNNREADPVHIWSSVCGQPIKGELYWLAYEAGAFPDDIPAAAPPSNKGADGLLRPGSNNAPVLTPAEDMAERIATAIANVNDLLTIDGKLAKPDKASADKATNAADRLRELEQEADRLYKADKRPHEESLSTVRLTWTPLIERAETVRTRLSKAAQGWARAEQARLDAIAEEARRRAADEAAKAAAAGLPPVEAAPVPEPERVMLGGAVAGRRTGVRAPPKVGKIVDMDKFFQAVKADPDIVEALQKKANALARAKTAYAGMEIVDGG